MIPRRLSIHIEQTLSEELSEVVDKMGVSTGH